MNIFTQIQMFFRTKIKNLSKWLWLILAVAAVGLPVWGGITLQDIKNKGWARYNPRDFRPCPSTPGVDSQGRIWLGGRDEVIVQPAHGDPTHYPKPNRDCIQNIGFDGQGHTWMGTRHGLYMLAPDGKWRTYIPPVADSALPSESEDIRALTTDRQGRVWIGTNEGLSVLATNGNWMTYTPANSPLASHAVSALVTDIQDRVWIGTSGIHYGDQGSLNVLTPDGRWTTYTSISPEMPISDVITLATDKQGQTWAVISSDIHSSRTHILTRFSPNGNHTNYDLPNYSPISSSITSLAIDEQGRVWAGREDALQMLAPDGSWTFYNVRNSGIFAENLWTSFRGRTSSRIFFDHITGLTIDQQDQLWITTSAEKIFTFNEDISTPVQVTNKFADLEFEIFLPASVIVFLLSLIVLGMPAMKALIAQLESWDDQFSKGLQAGLMFNLFAVPSIVFWIAPWIIGILMPDCTGGGGGFGCIVPTLVLPAGVIVLVNVGVIILLLTARRWRIAAGLFTLLISSLVLLPVFLFVR